MSAGEPSDALVRREVACCGSVGVGRARERLILRRGEARARAVHERVYKCDGAVGEREFDGHGIARVVEAERAGLQDECAAEVRVVCGRRAAAEDDDGPSGFERRVRGEGEADGRRVRDLHAGEFDGRVRIVEEFYELVVVRVANAVAVRIALDFRRRRVVGRNAREQFVDDERQAHVQSRVAGNSRAAIV